MWLVVVDTATHLLFGLESDQVFGCSFAFSPDRSDERSGEWTGTRVPDRTLMALLRTVRGGENQKVQQKDEYVEKKGRKRTFFRTLEGNRKHVCCLHHYASVFVGRCFVCLFVVLLLLGQLVGSSLPADQDEEKDDGDEDDGRN